MFAAITQSFALSLISTIGRGDLVFIALVGGDDLLHQMMTGNILFGEVDEAYAVYPPENAKSLLQSRSLSGR